MIVLGPACSLCPVNWRWVGGDTCFYLSETEATWQESEDFCFSLNATLLMLKMKSKLVRFQSYRSEAMQTCRTLNHKRVMMTLFSQTVDMGVMNPVKVINKQKGNPSKEGVSIDEEQGMLQNGEEQGE
ncbi:hypothetical protein Q9233_002594 [Columba guinea]|nr:hypothetical protein Q9233_002594 [Columba guinea]